MNDPETLMELIHRETERKISVRLEQMMEDFSEQLEVQREKLKEDFVGFSNLSSCEFNISFSRTSIFGRS